MFAGAKFRVIASNCSRRNFRGFKFVPSPRGDHTHIDRSGGSYFRGTQPIRENREILHHAIISHYMVYVLHVQNNVQIF